MFPNTTESIAARRDKRKADRAQRVREVLEHFDELPDSAHVRLPVMCRLYGCGPATVWRHVRLKLLPPPVHLGPKISGWNVGVIRADLKTKSAA